MREKKLAGSIITIGSINGGDVPCKEGAAYAASKAAVMHLTKTLVGELSPHRIRINCIVPGFFKTPMTEGYIEAVEPQIPLGSAASVEDMEGLVLYLASNRASRYITGACLTIDGGHSWGGQL